MTTSFTRTRTQIAEMTLRKLRVIGAAETPATADYDLMYEAIDLRLKEMHRHGWFWRKVTTTPVTFSVGAGVFSASAAVPDILFPIKITLNDGSDDIEMSLIGPIQYQQIPNKSESGFPDKVYWRGGTELIFHPVPTANGTGKLTYHRITDDSSAGAAIDVDVSMIRWIKDIIAYDVADDYGMDEAHIQRFAQEAIIAERNIRKLNAPAVDYAPVQVDYYDDPYPSRTKSDWNT